MIDFLIFVTLIGTLVYLFTKPRCSNCKNEFDLETKKCKGCGKTNKFQNWQEEE